MPATGFPWTFTDDAGPKLVMSMLSQSSPWSAALHGSCVPSPALHLVLRYVQSVCTATQRLLGEEPAIIASPGKYTLDFGSIVVCQSKAKVVQLRNASPQSFGFKINKRVRSMATL